jgi:hypothetical protein
MISFVGKLTNYSRKKLKFNFLFIKMIFRNNFTNKIIGWNQPIVLFKFLIKDEGSRKKSNHETMQNVEQPSIKILSRNKNPSESTSNDLKEVNQKDTSLQSFRKTPFIALKFHSMLNNIPPFRYQFVKRNGF